MHSRTLKTVLIWAMPWSFGLQFHDPIMHDRCCHAGYTNPAILAVLAVFAAKVTPTATYAIAATTGGATCAKKTEPNTASRVGTRQPHF